METSPELFGFFKYELRVRHAHVWSTAQGRFGTPLQIAGVPPLPCNVIRTHSGITATAPFAFPVLDTDLTRVREESDLDHAVRPGLPAGRERLSQSPARSSAS
jgi:hypothetical protein